jgi:hypothetical protein
MAQQPQGFFLDDWQSKTITSPDYNDVVQTTAVVNVSIKINFTDTITKVPKYVYGDNANPYTGFMTDNPTLMKNITNLNMGVVRGPGGSLSDYYFWDKNSNQRPTDIPNNLYGQTTAFTPWYGKRLLSETWRSDIDTFYSILKMTGNTGLLTANYGYARYGTSTYPVSQAAHYAANWVRYDNGRSKFWEIGNENFGNWEAGYQIDVTQNKDGQPQTISGDLYGKHCLVFIDSMKNAALQVGKDIKIGVVAAESSTTSSSWNSQLFAQVGDKADFYVIHSYYTPYNQNSTVSTILNSSPSTETFVNYVRDGLTSAGKPQKPIALDEWNIFATGSEQQISYINGVQASMMLGQVIKQKIGLACRWDLANGYSNGDDHGLFSYGSEPGVPLYNPRPAFYYMYYFQKYFGDVMLNSTVVGDASIVVYPSAFKSGQASAVIVNKGSSAQTVRVNIENFKFGNRYYTYTLTGGTDNGDFSLNVKVNGTGSSYAAGGPEASYETIKANSSVIDNEIRILAPPLSVTYFLVDSGQKQLAINETITPNSTPMVTKDDKIVIYPNPARDKIEIKDIPDDYKTLEIQNMEGQLVYATLINGKDNNNLNVDLSLPPGFYLVNLKGDGKKITKKLIIDQ